MDYKKLFHQIEFIVHVASTIHLANANFLQLQSEISDIENKLAATRRYFNTTTRELNSTIQSFPTNLFANMFGFHCEPMFEVPAEDRATYDKVPEIKF